MKTKLMAALMMMAMMTTTAMAQEQSRGRGEQSQQQEIRQEVRVVRKDAKKLDKRFAHKAAKFKKSDCAKGDKACFRDQHRRQHHHHHHGKVIIIQVR